MQAHVSCFVARCWVSSWRQGGLLSEVRGLPNPRQGVGQGQGPNGGGGGAGGAVFRGKVSRKQTSAASLMHSETAKSTDIENRRWLTTIDRHHMDMSTYSIS